MCQTPTTKLIATNPDPTPVGPDATGPAHAGLCTASSASSPNGKNENSVASKNLADAATTAGQTIEQFCTDVTISKPADTSTPSTDKHAEPVKSTDTGKPADAGKHADGGKSADVPPVAPPDHP